LLGDLLHWQPGQAAARSEDDGFFDDDSLQRQLASPQEGYTVIDADRPECEQKVYTTEEMFPELSTLATRIASQRQQALLANHTNLREVMLQRPDPDIAKREARAKAAAQRRLQRQQEWEAKTKRDLERARLIKAHQLQQDQQEAAARAEAKAKKQQDDLEWQAHVMQCQVEQAVRIAEEQKAAEQQAKLDAIEAERLRLVALAEQQKRDELLAEEAKRVEEAKREAKRLKKKRQAKAARERKQALQKAAQEEKKRQARLEAEKVASLRCDRPGCNRGIIKQPFCRYDFKYCTIECLQKHTT
jgi:hypothetical protein